MNTYQETAVPASKMFERLDEISMIRDKVNAANAPLEAELSRLIAVAEEARVMAEKVAAQIDRNRGGGQWIALKTEIRILSKALSPDPRLVDLDKRRALAIEGQ